MPGTVRKLVLDGTPQNNKLNCRFRVYLDDQVYWLTFKSFTYLTKLAIARLYNKDGMIHVENIGSTSQRKNISRLNNELDKRIDIQSKYWGYYFLDVDCRGIYFNHRQLHEFPHVEISEQFKSGKVGDEYDLAMQD